MGYYQYLSRIFYHFLYARRTKLITCFANNHVISYIYDEAGKSAIYIYTYIHIYIYTYIHIYIYTYIHIYIYTYIPIYIHTYICIPIYLYTYIHIYLYTYMHIYKYTYIPIYLYTYIHIYLYTYIPIYIHKYKYSILPITRTSKRPMKMVRVNECSSYPGQIMKKY